MKLYLILFSTLILSFSGLAQINKLTKSDIWELLYNDYKSNDFDNEDRLIISRGGDQNFRTEIGKIFYYQSGNAQKAAVILFSYDYTKGEKEDCFGCAPNFDVAIFSYINDQWVKKRFTKDWEGGVGAWGEPSEIEMKTYKNKKCLKVTLEISRGGKNSINISYYNVETLELVRQITKDE